MLGKVQTKIAGYKQQGTILYQKSVEMPGKHTNRDKVPRVEKQVPLLEKAVWEYC